MTEYVLNSELVNRVFLDCLYNNNEIKVDDNGNQIIPKDAVIVKGIVNKVGFNPERLNIYRKRVVEMLEELPDSFHSNKGGGMSFLKMHEDKNGNQWTDSHKIMDELLCLGLGLNLMEFCIEDRDMWMALPGNMPYITYLKGK